MEYHTITLGDNSAKISTFGAHCVSWVSGGSEQLFVSRLAVKDGSKAIRGGIPVIFPQFSDRGPLKSHGYARVSTFSVRNKLSDRVEMELKRPGDLTLVLGFQVGDGFLRVTLEVHAEVDTQFTGALHTYFACQDIATVRVQGLEHLRYQDHLQDKKEFEEQRSDVSIGEEVDRTYIGVGTREMRICEGRRQVALNSDRWNDAVLWNPWVAKSQRMGDFGDDEFHKMVCLEVGAVTQPVKVPAGQSWKSTHTMSVKKTASL